MNSSLSEDLLEAVELMEEVLLGGGVDEIFDKVSLFVFR